MSRKVRRRAQNGIPERLRPLFWDLDFDGLRWPRDLDQVTLRVLADGDWMSIQWLRRTLTDRGLRRWLVAREGRGLDPRRLRFWQLVLGLPRTKVDAWISAMRPDPWHGRGRR
jgi:hypothetical protein